MKRLVHLVLLSVLALSSLAASACSSAGANSSAGEAMGDMSMLPSDIQSAPTRVWEAYQFAIANADALKNVPCYCGCGAIGHKSNYDCFIQDAPPSGKPVFDRHALGCSICVDIAQDVRKLMKEN
ncbi:MAG: PCYCGC motif-containing (lipo)protein, partial [Rudaea sp.]